MINGARAKEMGHPDTRRAAGGREGGGGGTTGYRGRKEQGMKGDMGMKKREVEGYEEMK